MREVHTQAKALHLNTVIQTWTFINNAKQTSRWISITEDAGKDVILNASSAVNPTASSITNTATNEMLSIPIFSGNLLDYQFFIRAFDWEQWEHALLFGAMHCWSTKRACMQLSIFAIHQKIYINKNIIKTSFGDEYWIVMAYIGSHLVIYQDWRLRSFKSICSVSQWLYQRNGYCRIHGGNRSPSQHEGITSRELLHGFYASNMCWKLTQIQVWMKRWQNVKRDLSQLKS